MNLSKSNFDLNLSEIKPNSKPNKRFTLILAASGLLTIGLAVYTFIGYIHRDPTFKSFDGKVSITTSKEWSILKEDRKVDNNSMTQSILAIQKADHKFTPSIIFISRFNRFENTNIDELYENWKTIFKKNAATLDGIVTLDTPVPDMVPTNWVYKYKIKQVSFTEKGLMGITNTRFWTLMITDNSRYLITATTSPKFRQDFELEYKQILSTLRDKK